MSYLHYMVEMGEEGLGTRGGFLLLQMYWSGLGDLVP